jgi:AraC-like DNA-binding protein
MFRRGINPLKLRAVFISHLHGDHVFGLFPMLSTMGLCGRQTPLKVFAPRPFGEMLDFHLKYFDENLPYQVEWVEVDTTKHQCIFENRTVEVWSIPLRHKIPCAGFHFKEKAPELNVHKFKIEKYSPSIAQIVAAKRGEDITLEEVSRRVGYSTSYFSRIFKIATGQSYVDTITDLRLSNARTLLSNGYSVSESCFSSGFASGAGAALLSSFGTEGASCTGSALMVAGISSGVAFTTSATLATGEGARGFSAFTSVVAGWGFSGSGWAAGAGFSSTTAITLSAFASTVD